MNLIDLLVIVGVLVFAWSGWRQGFVAAFCSFAGFLGGGILGLFLAPFMLGMLGLNGVAGLAATAVVVLGLAIAGQIGMGIAGRILREKVDLDQVRILDNLGGAILNIGALAVVGWILASTAAAVPSSPVAMQVRSSALLSGLDSIVPGQARDLVGNLRGLVDDSGLPQLFDSFGVLPPAQVDVPSDTSAASPAVRRALGSVVKVEGNAPSCNSGFTGSGFVIAPGRVMTNAHVVAGVPQPRVHLRDGTWYHARTVYFDPRIDVAVLDVDELDATPLVMAGPAKRGDDAVIVGYPGGGDMTVSPARVRGTISSELARGTDIYGNPGVAREIYALRGIARPGNSGGPLFTTAGTVSGVVFAQAETDPDTAYALTADQVSEAVRRGTANSSTVSTGDCAK